MATDDRTLHIALLLAGALPVIGAIVRGGAVGGGITLCLLMMAIGAIGLVSGAWRTRRARVPVARAVRR